jgi:PAS domain S-box-containing protein
VTGATAAAPASYPAAATRPLDGPGRWLRLGPPVGLAALGIGLALAAPADRRWLVLLAGVLLLVIVAVAAVLPARRWPATWQLLPAVGLLPVAVLLDHAGAGTGPVLLAALPVVWAALFHPRWAVVTTLVLVGLVVLAPPALWPGAFPEPDWVTRLLGYGLAGAGGLLVQHLLARTRADRDLLLRLLDQAACLVVVTDREGRTILFNQLCQQLSGYSAAEACGRPVETLQGDPAGARRAFEVALECREWVIYEGDWITRNGTRRRIGWSGIGLPDRTGHGSHVIWTGLDLTETRQGQRLFKNVLRAASDQIIMAIDTTGTFTVFNPGAEQHLGYTKEEMVGKRTIAAVSLPEELDALAAEQGFGSAHELLTDPRGIELVAGREWTLVRKDGSRFPAMMTVSTMRDMPSLRRGPLSPRFNDVVGFVAIARDITLEREAEAATREALERERQAADRLRELDRVKNEFVATVSHDLRTPLTSIIGNTEMILDGDTGELPPIQRKLLAAVDRNARRLETLVADLLLLSRIESGTLRLHPRRVAMTDVIHGALESLAAKLTSDVQLDVHTPDEPVHVHADPAQLERVVTNLLSNALKFTPPGGQVTATVTTEPDQVRLSVTDTGIGIPEDELTRVFDRFFRSSRSQDRDRPGTGLGLTIAKSIIDQHHGTIQVSGNRTGGTTFTITLPRLPATSDAPEKEPA